MTAPVLLYDGTCGFCAASVQWVLRHDRRGTLSFAPLQGETAKPVLERHPELAGVDSIVWIGEGGEVRVRSDAAIAIGWYLGGVWANLATIAVGVPRGFRDRCYDFIAKHRHELTKNGPECLLPTPEERRRFLP
jgi:predicted DCC family thiol-disulfide oxidoreductase YuxK